MNPKSPRVILALVALIAVGVAAAIPSLAGADPLGKSTLQETIKRTTGKKFSTLKKGAGEKYTVRSSRSGLAKAKRSKTRSSLIDFIQLSDFQLADEMSPARVEFVDPAGGGSSSSHRPQEALGPWALNEIVRNVNRNLTSQVKDGKGKRAKAKFAIATGDLADNMQKNETEWFVGLLEGKKVDPFSGKAISATNSCGGATPAEIAKLNAAVANRQYTGVQDYSDYPGVPAARYGGFWDPNTPAPAAGGIYANFPRYPGLMDRAQKPLKAEGLKLPWYATFGNHDGLIQGNAPGSTALFRTIATSCLKVMPGPGFDPADFEGKSADQLFAELGNPAFIATLLGGARKVPPDPDRKLISKVDFRSMMGSGDKGHGFGYIDSKVKKASSGAASYYAFTPRPGFRVISLDTVAEGGGAEGNLDDPQYKWLEGEADKNSSLSYGSNGKLQKDGDKSNLIIINSHHTIDTLNNPTVDEKAGACTATQKVGCDIDTRVSTPIHLGRKGKETVLALLQKYPNVVLYVNGHTHENAVTPYFRKNAKKTGFWQVNTASHADWPQQSRAIEVMDNKDGSLSVFGTILDQGAPIAAPKAGTKGAKMTDINLGSLTRLLAANDPQQQSAKDDGAGKKQDRNVELLIADPRKLKP